MYLFFFHRFGRRTSRMPAVKLGEILWSPQAHASCPLCSLPRSGGAGIRSDYAFKRHFQLVNVWWMSILRWRIVPGGSSADYTCTGVQGGWRHLPGLMHCVKCYNHTPIHQFHCQFHQAVPNMKLTHLLIVLWLSSTRSSGYETTLGTTNDFTYCLSLWVLRIRAILRAGPIEKGAHIWIHQLVCVCCHCHKCCQFVSDGCGFKYSTQ